MDKNEKEIKNFKKIENFFQIDLIIKNLINNTFPNNADKNNPGENHFLCPKIKRYYR